MTKRERLAIAGRIDKHLKEVAKLYRSLPPVKYQAAGFRAVLTYHNLPGGRSDYLPGTDFKTFVNQQLED